MADKPVFLYAAVYDNIPDAESDADAASVKKEIETAEKQGG